MKIGIDKAQGSPRGTYSQHLAKVLSDHAPEHEYVVGAGRTTEVDIYHGFRPLMPLQMRLRRVPWVVTVPNLNFLRYPRLYSLPERMFLFWAYRRALRSANRLITVNGSAREELARRLDIDRRKIEVVMPLAALAPQEMPSSGDLAAVRRKYDLPERFVLMLGTVEPRHNHQALFEALLEARGVDAGVVVCGRRTAWSDDLLAWARERHVAPRIDFIYEPALDDLSALFLLARVFAYLPEAGIEASIIPVVEALRAGLPMILSDTQLNREAADNAALYVAPRDVGQLAAALENAVCDESFRREMRERAHRRAELFSEYAVAQRLVDIYSSL